MPGVAEEPSVTTSLDELPMRVGVGQFMDPTAERLRFIQQLGVDDILLNMYATPLLSDNDVPLRGDHEWDFQELVQLRNQVERADIRLNAIENIPIKFYDKIMLGKPGRDEQLDHVRNTIRNLGRAGIPILGYHWGANGVWRTSTSYPVRGDATATAFRAEEVENAPLSFDREYTEAEIWENYEYFLEGILPVAEEEGVTLALHPNDPPMKSIGGFPFLFRNVENVERAMSRFQSEHHGLNLCLGTYAEMGADPIDVIERFGGENIVYVHFRDVNGAIPSFNETFIDAGDYDEVAVLEALRDTGFSGMMIPDHVPRLEGDNDWKRCGRSYTVGYLKGLLRSL